MIDEVASPGAGAGLSDSVSVATSVVIVLEAAIEMRIGSTMRGMMALSEDYKST